MTVCPDCVKATLGPWHGFAGGCKGCAARAVARGPNFASSRARGVMTRLYREELELLGVTHDEVREVAKADKVEAG